MLKDNAICKGSFNLNTACYNCIKCLEEWNKLFKEGELIKITHEGHTSNQIIFKPAQEIDGDIMTRVTTIRGYVHIRDIRKIK